MEEAGEQTPTFSSEPTAENQTDPASDPTDTTKPEPFPELEFTDSGSKNMVYAPGFVWTESQGLNQDEHAEDIYENENNNDDIGHNIMQLTVSH